MIRTKCEARKMRTGQNCQGECREVLGKLTYLRKSFVEGFSRCKICEYWLDWRFCHLRSGEKANSESRGMYCNCCNYQVRQRPHSREAKETLERHNEQSTSSKEDNYNKPLVKHSSEYSESIAQRQEEYIKESKKRKDKTIEKFREIRNRMQLKNEERRQEYKKILEGTTTESNHTEKSLDEIREYFKKKFQEDPSLSEEFEILENYLTLLPKNEKYSDINYFLRLLK